VFKHPAERHYIRPEIASDLLACARASGAKNRRRVSPFRRGKQPAPPRLPEFFGTRRDGVRTLRVSQARFSALEKIRDRTREKRNQWARL